MASTITDNIVDGATIDMARKIKASYDEQLLLALDQYGQAQRKMTQAQHEVQRMEMHVDKINQFFKDNNIKDKEQ